MNCANHPEIPVASYCQFCGKPLCAECVHKINNIVSCEPCLVARVQATVPGSQPAHAGQVASGTTWGAEPWIAFILGWIPGVGAMYNGQFAKALAHVVIFALLVDLTQVNGLLGLLVAAWVFYQVFDAYQTAAARRDGLPLPNPLGLNDVAQWFGAKTTTAYPPASPWPGHAANPNVAGKNPMPASPQADPVAGFSAPYIPPPVPPTPQNPIDPQWHTLGGRSIPAGALVLIVLGIVFLLGNFGILSDHWLKHGWPILLIFLGIWLVIRRSQSLPPGGVR